jgi:WD40 repeat protein
MLASAGLDRTVRIWTTEAGNQLTSFEVKASNINALSFSPDGSLLAAGGGDFLRMGEVRVWQMEDVIDE